MAEAAGRSVDLVQHLTRFQDADQLTGACGGSETIMRLSRRIGEGAVMLANLGAVRFRAMSLSGSVRIQGVTPAGHAAVQLDLGSDSGRHYNGQLLEKNDIAFDLGETDYDFVSASEHRGMSLLVPDSMVLDALVTRTSATGNMPRSSRLYVAAGCWPQVSLVRKLAAEIFGSPKGVTSPRATQFATSALIDALVGVIMVPFHRSGGEVLRPAHYQRMPLVRRAEDFMRAGLGDPIMLHDICRAARASERAVTYAFHDVYGVGPKQYLKLLRLNEVRRDLKALPAEVATVEDIACNNGLWHMGHFTVDYRRLFGESPRETRGRRRAEVEHPGRPATAADFIAALFDK